MANRPYPKLLVIPMLIWFASALAIGATLGGIGGPNFVAISIAAPMLLWSLAYAFMPTIRAAIDAVSLRALVLIHTGRVFGGLFLLYSGRGLYPAWAQPAAWADLAVAALAIPIALLAIPIDTAAKWRWAMAWNLFAVLDIVAAPGSGLLTARLIPGSMDAMAELPLYIVPAFFVPTMILTNILITRKLLADRHQHRLRFE